MTFALSKLFWMFAAPANLFCLLLLLGAFLAVSRRPGFQRLGRRLCFLLAISVFLIGIFPVGEWAVKPLEDLFPPQIPERVDGIILLAGDEDPHMSDDRGEAAISTSARRYLTFAALAHKYPEARLAFVGGNPAHRSYDPVSNAAVARKMLNQLGIPEERMTYEDVSRNTNENAKLGLDVIKPQPGQNWVLVTSAFHMPRALLCFRNVGWNIFPATTDYLSPATYKLRSKFMVFDHFLPLHFALHEYFGIVTYWMMGRIVWPWSAAK